MTSASGLMRNVLQKSTATFKGTCKIFSNQDDILWRPVSTDNRVKAIPWSTGQWRVARDSGVQVAPGTCPGTLSPPHNAGLPQQVIVVGTLEGSLQEHSKQRMFPSCLEAVIYFNNGWDFTVCFNSDDCTRAGASSRQAQYRVADGYAWMDGSAEPSLSKSLNSAQPLSTVLQPGSRRSLNLFSSVWHSLEPTLCRVFKASRPNFLFCCLSLDFAHWPFSVQGTFSGCEPLLDLGSFLFVYLIFIFHSRSLVLFVLLYFLFLSNLEMHVV